MDGHNATRQPQPPASPAEGDRGSKRQRTGPIGAAYNSLLNAISPPKKSPPGNYTQPGARKKIAKRRDLQRHTGRHVGAPCACKHCALLGLVCSNLITNKTHGQRCSTCHRRKQPGSKAQCAPAQPAALPAAAAAAAPAQQQAAAALVRDAAFEEVQRGLTVEKICKDIKVLHASKGLSLQDKTCISNLLFELA